MALSVRVLTVITIAALAVGGAGTALGTYAFMHQNGKLGQSGLNGAPGANGANGSPGSSGGAGATGATGSTGATGGTGASGGSVTYASLSFTFALATTTTGLVMSHTACTATQNGVSYCQLAITNTGTQTQKVGGLSYTQSAYAFFGGANPTLGWITLAANGVTTAFSLWFQASAGTAQVNIAVVLFTSPA